MADYRYERGRSEEYEQWPNPSTLVDCEHNQHQHSEDHGQPYSIQYAGNDQYPSVMNACASSQVPEDTPCSPYGGSYQEMENNSRQHELGKGPGMTPLLANPQVRRGRCMQPSRQEDVNPPPTECVPYEHPSQDFLPQTMAPSPAYLVNEKDWNLDEIYSTIGKDATGDDSAGLQNVPYDASIAAYFSSMDGAPYHATENLTTVAMEDIFNPSQQMEAATEAQTDMNWALDRSPLDTLDDASLDPKQFNTMNFSANAGPWTPFQKIMVNQVPLHCTESRGVCRQETSDTTRSMLTQNNTVSSHLMTEDPTTPMSSRGLPINEMGDSVLTARPLRLTAYRMMSNDPLFHFFQCNIEEPAIPQMEQPNSNIQPSSEHLAPLMQKNISSAPSSTTEASSADGSSTGVPSPDAADVLYCVVIGCLASFSGMYRKGNLARHQRHNHNRTRICICESESCDKVFKRQDARLKHYRKYHPRLAADRPYVARRSQGRCPGGDQDADLRSISGWT
ncbi:hypothetical protein EJ02DRAFT_262904 [Clathrospora elynae]|uniref:C2H2-type domain-containing protein n=1 Tax=Clathrospora elynae TaxID=706981 RepID=A0A6A5T2A7_9PLEO|nr:hypothetical protein EJ02DRAFT_262904 [Clathrospora elynae]